MSYGAGFSRSSRRYFGQGDSWLTRWSAVRKFASLSQKANFANLAITGQGSPFGINGEPPGGGQTKSASGRIAWARRG